MRTALTGASAFDDDDVARAYAYRPPYPRSLYDFLTRLPRRRSRALDLGCGPGKIARNLAVQFEHVDALDPSLPMLHLADDGRFPNITWIHASAETAQLTAAYNLVTAGASIHWMDHAVVFPKLAKSLDEGGVVAVIDGDEAHDAPWQADWELFMRRWLTRLGSEYDPCGHQAALAAFHDWMTVAGEREFQAPFTQSVEHLIECQHSRATWSRANLGGERAAEFDAELRAMLLPHATNGAISYTTKTRLVWGVPKCA